MCRMINKVGFWFVLATGLASPSAQQLRAHTCPTDASDTGVAVLMSTFRIDADGNISFLATYIGGLQHFGTDTPNQPTGSTAISVHVDRGPSCSIQPSNQTVCQGVSATFTATGSGQGAPFSFTWTGPNGFTASAGTITVRNAGTYTATVTDVHGCQSTCTAALAVNPNPTCEIGG